MMKLRFAVNQAECLRNGIDQPNSIHVIDVDPSHLSQKDRNRIADRMKGIEVMQLHGEQKGQRIEAQAPTLAALLDAIDADEDRVGKGVVS